MLRHLEMRVLSYLLMKLYIFYIDQNVSLFYYHCIIIEFVTMIQYYAILYNVTRLLKEISQPKIFSSFCIIFIIIINIHVTYITIGKQWIHHYLFSLQKISNMPRNLLLSTTIVNSFSFSLSILAIDESTTSYTENLEVW